MSRFGHETANIILQRFVLSIVENGQALNCCNSLIPVILIDVRVLIKLLSFFTTRNVQPITPATLSSAALGKRFCQQICNNFQRIQLVQRDETDLCQLLNPHRLRLQVFCSAPWSKPLHDGFCAAALSKLHF